MDIKSGLIRSATLDDIPSLVQIELDCFSMPWSKKGFEEFFSNGCSVCLVYEIDKKICAYVGMNLISGEGEITNIAVLKEYRRLGIGALLLERLLKTDGLFKVMLDVRESNLGAIALYERFGFMVDGKRRGFYQNPREDAILMSRNMNIQG